MRAYQLIFLAALPANASAEVTTPVFADRASALPVSHIYSGGWEHFVGGGVAVFDCNGDDLPEILAAGGESPARLFINETPEPGAAFAFGAGDFLKLTGVTGAYPLDIDGDSHLDLAVLRVGPNLLLKGDGQCGFIDHSAEWGLAPEDRWTTAFTATWEGDGLPTLVFGNYVDRKDPEGPFEACDINLLYRPDPENPARYDAPETISPGFCALSMLISDWQRKGTPELRISNDRHYYVRGGYEEMWRLNPLEPRGEADGWERVSLWGMGIASADLQDDGFPDVMLTSMGDQLLQFNENGELRAAPYSTGSYAQQPHIGDDGRPTTGWHAEFGDLDNDGTLDLFIAKGNVDQMPSNAIEDPNNLLMQSSDGVFHERSIEAGVATVTRSRGASISDFDGDGRLDLVVVNRRAPLELWQNQTENTGNWLTVALEAPAPNTQAVGAWIELRLGDRLISQEVTVGGGHASGEAGPHHFGLGSAEMVQIRVIWPDGNATEWREFEVNQQVTLTAG